MRSLRHWLTGALILFAVGQFAAAPPARAEGITVEEFLGIKELAKTKPGAETVLAAYLMALESGVFSADAYVRLTGGEPIYCPPDDADFSWPAVRDLIEGQVTKEIEAGFNPAVAPLSVIYLKALVTRYPCN